MPRNKLDVSGDALGRISNETKTNNYHEIKSLCLSSLQITFTFWHRRSVFLEKLWRYIRQEKIFLEM